MKMSTLRFVSDHKSLPIASHIFSYLGMPEGVKAPRVPVPVISILSGPSPSRLFLRFKSSTLEPLYVVVRLGSISRYVVMINQTHNLLEKKRAGIKRNKIAS